MPPSIQQEYPEATPQAVEQDGTQQEEDAYNKTSRLPDGVFDATMGDDFDLGSYNFEELYESAPHQNSGFEDSAVHFEGEFEERLPDGADRSQYIPSELDTNAAGDLVVDPELEQTADGQQVEQHFELATSPEAAAAQPDEDEQLLQGVQAEAFPTQLNETPNYNDVLEDMQAFVAREGIDVSTLDVGPVAGVAEKGLGDSSRTDDSGVQFEKQPEAYTSPSLQENTVDFGIPQAQFEDAQEQISYRNPTVEEYVEDELGWEQTAATPDLGEQHPPISAADVNTTAAYYTPATAANPTVPPVDTRPAFAHYWKDRAVWEEGRWLSQPVKGDYTSMLITNPTIVNEWIHQQAIHPDDVCRLLQYYIIVVQVYGKDTRDEILQLRHQAQLHDLDHRVAFADTGGIPVDGWYPAITYRHQLGPRHQPQYKKNPQGFELVDFPSITEPMPIGTTDADMLRYFPNHLKEEFLDSAIQNGISYGVMFRCIQPDAFRLLKETRVIGVVSRKSDENNFLNKRHQKRRNKLLTEKYPNPGDHEQFLNCQVRIRPVGNLLFYRPGSKKGERSQDYAHPINPPSGSIVPVVGWEPVPLPMQQPMAPAPVPAAVFQQQAHMAPYSPFDVQPGGYGSTFDAPIDSTSDDTLSSASIQTPEAQEVGVKVASLSDPLQQFQNPQNAEKGKSGINDVPLCPKANLPKFKVGDNPAVIRSGKAMNQSVDEASIIANAIRLFVTSKYAEVATCTRDSPLATNLGKKWKAFLLRQGHKLSRHDREGIKAWADGKAKSSLCLAIDDQLKRLADEQHRNSSLPPAVNGKQRAASSLVDETFAPTEILGMTDGYGTQQQPQQSFGQYPTVGSGFQRPRPSKKRGMIDMDDGDDGMTQMATPQQKRAMHTARSKASAYSGISLNPPTAQTARKHDQDDVDGLIDERSQAGAKKMRYDHTSFFYPGSYQQPLPRVPVIEKQVPVPQPPLKVIEEYIPTLQTEFPDFAMDTIDPQLRRQQPNPTDVPDHSAQGAFPDSARMDAELERLQSLAPQPKPTDIPDFLAPGVPYDESRVDAHLQGLKSVFHGDTQNPFSQDEEVDFGSLSPTGNQEFLDQHNNRGSEAVRSPRRWTPY